MNMLDKVRAAGAKIKKSVRNKNIGMHSFLPNMNIAVVKKLMWGLILVNLGLTAVNVRTVAQFEKIKDAVSVLPPVGSSHQYNIRAPRQGLADSLEMVLNDMRHINPLTRGCIEDIIKHDQKFIILPDSAIQATAPGAAAFYINGAVHIPEGALKRYKRGYDDYGDAYIHRYVTDAELNKSTFDLYNTILHECRHAQQARYGIILAQNMFYQEGDILDYVMISTRCEADASQYADFCLYDENGKIKTQIGTTQSDWEAKQYMLLDRYNMSEIANLNHVLKKHDIKYFFNSDQKNTPVPEKGWEIEKLFDEMRMPISMHSGELKYLKTENSNVAYLNPQLRKDIDEYFGSADAYLRVLPYIYVLQIGETGDVIDMNDTKTSVRRADAKLNKLRCDRHYAIEYFETELRRQRPELFAARDKVQILAPARDDR